ncbi:6-phosphogluconolactonase [Ahrensia sp. R2A130]|uniref:6-phosphogluconolactonase n=1 Tax=Ahrensia sp. R2A130 TaxID=744979 RepID=UPI0001E083F2|nr:6-phosphogluconolactonase [Ahrensia sp. R2A130]EFL89241.1 6-phosphogluconolactonase [Ahrensia sp. R2A130]
MAIDQFIEFETREDLANQLAEDVATRLETDIEAGHFASLALSGGSTPKLFLQTLAKNPSFESDMTYLAMVDERFVPPTHERSNERMIRDNAGLQDHPDSEFLSLWRDAMTPGEAAAAAGEKLAEDEERPFDVLVLGMGEDGHTASFFPGSPQLAAATDPKQAASFLRVEAPDVPDPRITMTLPVIVEATYLVLHIEGEKKRAVFEEAMKDGPADDLPIRHVLRHPDAHLNVYWAP